MKKIFFLIFIAGTSLSQTSFAQDTSSSEFLQTYFNIKNALVSGNAKLASTDAQKFVTQVKSSNLETLAQKSREALLKPATQISQTENIEKQRVYFASLSISMHDVVKTTKPNKEAVYYSYCPMKKSYWLSENNNIKNPYFGSSMLTCGKVTEVIQ